PLPHDVSDRASAPLLAGSGMTPEVASVVDRVCANCHSEKTRWPWYSNVAPASWLVGNDVKRGRKLFNMSRWEDVAAAEQDLLLKAMSRVIENREMRPHRYVVLRPEAKLSVDETVQIIEWTRAERRRLRASAASK